MVWALPGKLTWALQMFMEGPRALLDTAHEGRWQNSVPLSANNKVNTVDARSAFQWAGKGCWLTGMCEQREIQETSLMCWGRSRAARVSGDEGGEVEVRGAVGGTQAWRPLQRFRV